MAEPTHATPMTLCGAPAGAATVPDAAWSSPRRAISRMMQCPPLAVDRSAAAPLYHQIATQLRDAIEEGRLLPGARLPTIRELAGQLHVGRITVINAYEQLQGEGYLAGQRGSGTRVALTIPDVGPGLGRLAAAGHAAKEQRGTPGCLSERARCLAPTTAVWHPDRAEYDFRAGGVGCDLMPYRQWDRSVRAAWADLNEGDGRRLLGGRQPAGDPLLREVLAEYLAATRGVRCTAEDIVVTAGAQVGLMAAAMLWLEPGRVGLVENPGDPAAHRAMSLTGANIVPAAVDGDGLRPDGLPQAASLVVVRPSWQFPLGGVMPLARRRDLLRWAAAGEVMIVEHDADGDVRYDAPALVSLQGMGSPDQVIYVGELDCLLFAGLGLGFAVAPAAVRAAYTSMVACLSRPPSVQAQRAAAIFMREGHLHRHLRRLRVAYAERQDALLEALQRWLPDCLAGSHQAAGTHMVVKVVDPAWTARHVQNAAAGLGVALDTLEPCYATPYPDDRILLNFAGMTPERIQAGIARLSAAMTSP